MKDIYYEGEVFEDLIFQDEIFEDCRFSDCTFINCNFEECKLIRCSFTGCQFNKCSILNLIAENNSHIQFTEFKDCQLVGINWSNLLSSGKFPTPISSMQDCRLKYGTFTNMDLRKFDFSGNEILHCIFAECQLIESNFSNCQLHRTEFFKSDLRKTNFKDSLGYQVDIMSCNMKDAKFSFPEAINLLNSLGVKIN